MKTKADLDKHLQQLGYEKVCSEPSDDSFEFWVDWAHQRAIGIKPGSDVQVYKGFVADIERRSIQALLIEIFP